MTARTQWVGVATREENAHWRAVARAVAEELAVDVLERERAGAVPRAESALLFNYVEVDAIVHVGGNDTRWSVPAVERAIAGDPEAAAVLGQPQQLEASRVCGVTNQQGASRLRSLVY